ncbi:MAG: nitroreductase [Betaproteobacteria bacterium]|nr:nitroreductase [Betaproteobacteria bacterium]
MKATDMTGNAAAVDAAIRSRRSIRRFLPRPVPRETIEAILAAASRAPSGSNIQPWRVYVVMGASRDALVADALAAHDADRGVATPVHQADYEYYPRNWFEPYIGRRRQLGWSLYSLLGIGKGDFEKSHAHSGRNFRFFDAPVGMLFAIDRRLEQGSWLDYGMFIENIMIAARGRALDTCPQQAWCRFHRLVARHVGMAEHEQLVCGMALGYADPDAIENQLKVERAPVAEFARFLGD